MKDRVRVSTGNPFEKRIGFSRAVKAGNMVFCAGTIAVDKDGNTQGDSCYEQCCYILDKMKKVLKKAGSKLDHTVRVVCYLTSLKYADEFEKAHKEYFGKIQPATTCIQVCKLFGKNTKVEIELTTVIPD